MWILKWRNDLLLLYFRGFLSFYFWLKFRWGQEKKSHTPKTKKGKNVSEFVPFMWTEIIFKPLQQTLCITVLHRNVLPVFFVGFFIIQCKISFSTSAIWLAGEHFIPNTDFKGIWSFFLKTADTLEMWVLQFKKHFCWALKAVLVGSRLWLALDALAD